VLCFCFVCLRLVAIFSGLSIFFVLPPSVFSNVYLLVYYPIFGWWSRPSDLFDRLKLWHSNLCFLNIKYIMYKVQDYSVLYNNVARPVICNVGILLACWKHLHDCIISLRWEVCAHKTCLTPSLFIKVPVRSKKSKRSCILCIGGIDFDSFYDFCVRL